MKQITVISGKGGTGKTVLTASFAALAKKACFVDCDVDAANLHLVLNPKILESREFTGGKKAVIDTDKCNQCGKCVEVCRFNAISSPNSDGKGSGDFRVDQISCEGCTVCSLVCPVDAIRMEEKLSGKWFISDTKYGPFVHARLEIAQENSGKLVARIREIAREIAQRENLDYVIIDGPPGIGCPVIASLSGVDLALVVAEPTLSGIHDMARIMDVASHFNIPVKVIINKHDINVQNSRSIEKFCREREISVLGHIPFSEKVVESVRRGIPVVESGNDKAVKEIVAIWDKVVVDVI